MTSKLKGAVVGCGFFAQNHLAGWKDIQDVEIVAVCDLDIEKAKAAATKFGIAYYTDDVNALFATQTLDFVDLPTTMETHESLVGAAVEQNIPVIVQKPFAPDFEGCRRMVAAAAERNVTLMVHEDFRFQNVFRAAKKIIDSGTLGKLTFGRFSWRTAIDVYSNQPYLINVKRFMIMDVGIHLLDLARFLFGEAQGVFCRTQQIKEGITGEDAATILLTHDNGATTVLDFSYASRRHPDLFPQTLVEIEGTLGTLTIGPNQVLTVHSDGQSREEQITHDSHSWTYEPWTQIQDSVVHTQRHFVESLRHSIEPETSGRDSLLTYGLLEAAYLSASTGQQVVPERD
ncbi:Gfo/Idh/MocA family oxidoreductase [Citrobacter sp. JGM124]|uniref:Gfo/Idh/MocA family protein n=1 Tax=Citrobacter sp. JGM124 TaxID=2799789 RepID=UPI001BA532CB|nr:Gfo/Idh/MocA family oxidoreductase [Citrobacter sp. JGM124]MBS0849157.1 Gfo/Idh/MocA family oxidoreductase [Citrobacter sp. JGM124]